MDARAANQNCNMNNPRNDEEHFPTICLAGNALAHDGGEISHGTMALVGDCPIRLRFETAANSMRSIWPIRDKNRAFSIVGQQRSNPSRTGKRPIQLAGSAVQGSLGLDLRFLFLSFFLGCMSIFRGVKSLFKNYEGFICNFGPELAGSLEPALIRPPDKSAQNCRPTH
jgi:hypothetical protein